MKELNTFTKSALGLGLVFLIYGVLSRSIPIRFFWEAQAVGWGFIFLGLIGLLAHGIKKKKASKQNSIWYKIGIGVISFILLIQATLLIVIPNTDAFEASKQFIVNNEEMKLEVGEIQGFGFMPSGAISVQSDSDGETGNANINLIVKGEKAFKSVTVFVFKDYGKDWEVYGIE